MRIVKIRSKLPKTWTVVEVVTLPIAEAFSPSDAGMNHYISSVCVVKHHALILFVLRQSSEHLDQIRYPCPELVHCETSLAL